MKTIISILLGKDTLKAFDDPDDKRYLERSFRSAVILIIIALTVIAFSGKAFADLLPFLGNWAGEFLYGIGIEILGAVYLFIIAKNALEDNRLERKIDDLTREVQELKSLLAGSKNPSDG